MDYKELGFTPEEEKLLIRMWNHGMEGRAASVWRIVFTNGAITLLLVYAVANGSWLVGDVALTWVIYNTVLAAVWAARDAPLWHSVMTKIEALLDQVPPPPPQDLA